MMGLEWDMSLEPSSRATSCCMIMASLGLCLLTMQIEVMVVGTT